MEYKFSDKVSGLKASAIREILKFTSVPGVISFAAGNPAPEAFPTERIAELSAELLRDDPVLALQYNITEGYTPLREFLKEWMTEKNCFHKEFDDIIVTSGGQQANELSCKVLLNEGDTLLCESPSFIGSLNAFRSYNVNLVGVEMDEDGINLEKLEDALKTQPNVKILYLIPNFQNPTGRTMSLEKRKAVYELACRYDFIILEDDPYGELRFAGENIPSIKSLDTEGLVIYSGSFSKIVAPGVRVGFVVANEKLIAKFTVAKQTQDVHTPLISQLIVYKWLTEFDFEAHINKIRDIYRRKLNLLCDCLDKEVGSFFDYQRPEGGLFVWAKLPDGVDMLEFVKKASAAGVSVVPGNAFLCDGDAPCDYVRLNFSTPSDEDIVKGVKILGEVAKTY